MKTNTIKITVELSYYVSSKKSFTKKEAFDHIKNKMRAGVRYEEFNRPKKVK